MKIKNESVIAMIVNNEGIIEDVLLDSITADKEKDIERGKFTDLLISDSRTKGVRFLEDLFKTGSAHDWELNIRSCNGTTNLNFAGAAMGRRAAIVGSGTTREMESLVEELMMMNNEHTNMLRGLISSQAAKDDDHERRLFEDLTRLNNELSAMHRELYRKNMQLEELNKLKNRMVGIAAHDLRNPLSVVWNYADFLLAEYQDPLTDKQRMYVENIRASSRYMLKLVEDLLDVARIESGKLILKKERISLDKLIIPNLDLNGPIADKKEISIVHEGDIQLIDVEVDRGKMDQVINNLLGNAIKYSPHGSKILVSSLSKKRNVRICVKDEGPGIPEEDRKNLFEPFQMGREGEKKGKESHGLGLAIAKSIVEGHGGRIWVESDVGSGSVFCFTIPVN
jgi:signal transduction histidine kinase